jgi:hypothetical protein
MRKSYFMLLILLLQIACVFMQMMGSPMANAYSSVYDESLFLMGNNVTVIEGEFSIKGSILIEENATLVLRNAVLNFTQPSDEFFDMNLRNPVNGNPSLLIYNSTITSPFRIDINLYDNSTAVMDNSTIAWYLFARDSSTVSISNSSYVGTQFVSNTPTISVQNSTVKEWQNYGSPTSQVYDSEIDDLTIAPFSANCTISNLKSGSIDHWNFPADCLVSVPLGGTAPNITLIDTTVQKWMFSFYGSSNATIDNSAICSVSAFGSSNVSLADSTADSYLYCRGSSIISMFNSTYSTIDAINEYASIHVCWYLDIQALDHFDQEIPSANVTAIFANATVASLKQTDLSGQARLILEEKVLNATGEYSLGEYKLHLTYETHSNNASIIMDGNQQLTLRLESLVIPEFPTVTLLQILIIATIVALITLGRKYSSRTARIIRSQP